MPKTKNRACNQIEESTVTGFLTVFLLSTNWANEAFRGRWETLMSVDDLVSDIYDALKSSKKLDNSYIIFTSDHGYHTGQFSLPYDKRQMYDFDLRIPLLVRGPTGKFFSSNTHLMC